jgi:hypothetical protein
MKVMPKDVIESIVKKGKHLEDNYHDGFNAIVQYGYNKLSTAQKAKISEQEYIDHLLENELGFRKLIRDHK